MQSSATHSETRPNDQARRGVWLCLALVLVPSGAAAHGSLVAAVGGGGQLAGGTGVERSAGASFETGLALDVGSRLRVALTGLYAPDVGAEDRVARGLWRVGPSARLFVAGASTNGGPWLGFGGGLGATADVLRPYGRIDLGWSLGTSVQVGLGATVLRELDSFGDGGTFVLAMLRFDGSSALLQRGAPPVPSPAEAPAPPPPAPVVALPDGAPLDQDVVRSGVRSNRDDLETCLALAHRRGVSRPPRLDLSLVIRPDGHVHAADVRGAPPPLGRCIERQAKRWTFPRAVGTTWFEAPFVLR